MAGPVADHGPTTGRVHADRFGEYLDEVLTMVEQVPAGRVTTYGALADAVRARLGRGGPRQVGQVLAHAGSAVPWWRVVDAGGAPPARHALEALGRLVREGVPLVAGGTRVALPQAFWEPPGP